MKKKCQVAYLFSKNVQEIHQTFQPIVSQLEKLVVGRTGVFEKYSKSMNMATVALVLYLMPAGDRVNEDIKDYMNTPLLTNMTSKNKEVVVVFLRSYDGKGIIGQIKVPDKCAWVEVVCFTNYYNNRKQISSELDITKRAITRLREMIKRVCPDILLISPHNDNYILFSMMIMMMV